MADDQTELSRQRQAAWSRTAPARIAGLIEVRGLGIVKVGRDNGGRAAVALLVDLARPSRDRAVARAAARPSWESHLPVVSLAPFEASAAAKLRLALARIASGMIGDVSAMPDSPATSTHHHANATRAVPFVLVTGMSGAGRTTALKALEDLGYEAVDNLPLSLLGDLMRSTAGSPGDDGAPAAGHRRRHPHLRLRAAATWCARIARASSTRRHRRAAAVPRLRRRDPAAPLHRDAPPPSAGARPAGEATASPRSAADGCGCAIAPTS